MPLISTIASGEASDTFQYTNISSATTTTCKSGMGTLIRIVNNRKVANGVIITNPATLLDNAQVFEYGVGFDTGLTIVTTAADNLTVVWR
jgi:hypothetical protein